MLHPRLTQRLQYTSEWLFAFSFSVVLAATAACAQARGKDYFPLKDGAKWEYSGRFSSSSGKEFSVRAITRVDGEILINGKRYSKFVTVSDFSGVPGISRQVEDVRYYRFAEDGIYFSLGNATDKPDLLEMPLPIPVGAKWFSGTTEVHADSAGTIQVGGQDYRDCLKVTFKVADGVRSIENYYAPDVGIIRIVYVNATEPKSIIELTLEKYER